MKKLLLTICSVLLLAACEKQSELVMYMEIDNVDWKREYVPSGTNLHFLIDAESQSSTIQRIALMASDMTYKDRLILDTIFLMPVKREKMSFYYTLPYYEDTLVVSFKGVAYDGAGRAASFPIDMHVTPGAEPIRPIDNITLYSAASSGKSAFSLETMQTEYLGSDSTAVAWFDVLKTQAGAEELSREWHSEAGIKFSRAEGFNFAEATSQSITSTWKNLTASTTIKQLKTDDVLLFGHNDEALGAIKLIAVYDEAGTENDRYVFSLKAIKKQPTPNEENKNNP